MKKVQAAATTKVEGSKNIEVQESIGANGNKVYKVGLKDKITLGNEANKKIDLDGETGIAKIGDQIIMDGKTGDTSLGKVKINGKDGTVDGLTNKNWDSDKIVSGRAATEDQLKIVDNKIKKVEDKIKNVGNAVNKGLSFEGDTGSTNKKLGETLKITGDNKNITTSVKDGKLKIKLNKEIKVEKIITEKLVLKNKDNISIDIAKTLEEHTRKINKGLNFKGNHGNTNKKLGDTMSIKGKDGVLVEDVESKYDKETNHRIDKIDEKMHRGFANAVAMSTIEFMEIGINGNWNKSSNCWSSYWYLQRKASSGSWGSGSTKSKY